MWTRQAIRKFVRDASAQAAGQALFYGLILAISAVLGVGLVVWRRAGDGPASGDIAIVLVVILFGATLAMQWKPNRPERNEPDSKPATTGPPIPGDYYDLADRDKTTRKSTADVEVTMRAEAIPLDWEAFDGAFLKGVEVGVAGPMGGPALAHVTVVPKQQPMESVVLRVSGPRFRGTRAGRNDHRRPHLDPLPPGTTETSLDLGSLSKNRPVEILLLVDAPGFGPRGRVEFDWFLESRGELLLSDTFAQNLG